MSKLVVFTPDGARREYKLRAINTMGRHPGQSVQILDRVVSKEHSLITFVDGTHWLQDMGSFSSAAREERKKSSSHGLHQASDGRRSAGDAGLQSHVSS
jgi:adenylate cyclase